MKKLEEYKEKLIFAEQKLKKLMDERHISDRASIERQRELNNQINNARQVRNLYQEFIDLMEPSKEDWIHLSVGTGSPECKAQLRVIPPGPYVHIHQHQESEFIEKYYVMNLLHKKNFLYVGDMPPMQSEQMESQ